MSTIRLPIHSGALCAETDAQPGSTGSLSPMPRPNMVRVETDNILSYYQSEHAGRSFDYASAQPVFESQPGPHDPTTTSHVLPQSLGHTHGRQPSAFSSVSDCSSTYSRSDDSIAPPVSALPSHPAPDVNVNAAARRTSASTASGIQSTSEHGNPIRHTRRPSVPSEGGADRRRLAIVEMDVPATAPLSVGRKRSKGLRAQSELDGKSSLDSSSSFSAGTLFARRGLHIGGLALVAPPDASPVSYSDLTPPSTAPISTSTSSGSTVFCPPSALPTHTRSASEAVNSSKNRSHLHHKTSRDVGIVGLSPTSTTSESVSPTSPSSEEYHIYAQTAGLGVPLFQTPAKSRSSSPGGATPDLSDTSSRSAFRSPHQRLLSTPIFGMDDGIVTPGIGEGKDIRQPVVGPVIVGLSPELLHGMQTVPTARASSVSPHARYPTSPSPSTQFLHYQPGIHSTAGPLPPPPRSIFDRGDTTAPPRPPRLHTPLPPGARRDIDAIKEALQLPQSVSAKLAARTSPAESESQTEKKHPEPKSPLRRDTISSIESESRSQESVYSQEFDHGPSIKLISATPVHVREGAFPPSKILSRKQAEDPVSPRSDARPVVVIEQDDSGDEQAETMRRPGLELHRESSWVSLSDAASRLSSPNGNFTALATVSISRSPSNGSVESSLSSVSRLPSLPPKSTHGGSDDEKAGTSVAPSAFKGLTNLKRFSSLPRTPSRSSRSSLTSPDARRSLSPSPYPPPRSLSPPRRRPIPKPKHIHVWPPAMNDADVVVLKSARQRAEGYAMKINELSTYDCGLREWMAMAALARSVPHSRVQSQRTTHQIHHPLPMEFGAVPDDTPRHVSHGSMASEMTFPTRPDAYTATDLSVRTGDLVPSSAPPAILPYPSLAQAQLRRAPARSSTLLLSPTKTLQIPLPLPGTKGSGTGFFASLGRKTSIRKDKGLPSPNSPPKTLTKHRPQAQAIATSRSNPSPPRPAQQPPIPGGPRAAPGRMQRAKTYSVGPGPIQQQPTPIPPQPEAHLQSKGDKNQRQSTLATRRPSLFARARQAHTSVVPSTNRQVPADPAFERSVDKLADLLPHAERVVLAGYLRRAGEDILAIGQYLEDEKNGTLKRD